MALFLFLLLLSPPHSSFMKGVEEVLDLEDVAVPSIMHNHSPNWVPVVLELGPWIPNTCILLVTTRKKKQYVS